MYKKRSYRPRRKTAAPKRKYAKRVYKKSSFASKVKKVIHRMAENKVLSGYAANQSIAWAGSVTNPTNYKLVPAVRQGGGSNQRVGNQIRVTKAIVRGYVNLKPYSATNNPYDYPIYVKMWLCRRQTTNVTITGVNPTTADWAQFFQTGNSAVGFQSNMLDMMLYHNKDYWNVFQQKTIQLSTNFASGSVITNPGSGRVSTSFYFDVTKYLGNLKFNDDNADYVPTNKELLLVFQAVKADGSTPGALLDVAEYHIAYDYQFEDL